MKNQRVLMQRTSLTGFVFALCMLVFSHSAHSQTALETDRLAGKCAMYAVLAGKDNAAYAALGMAASQRRAETFLTQALNEAKRMRESGDWEGPMKIAFLAEHERACRSLGIRVSDY